MIVEEKLTAFLCKAAELRQTRRQQVPPPPADPPDSLSSAQVVAALGWSEAEQCYFQADADNLVRELEYQGAVVIWEEGQGPAEPADARGLVYTFTVTDKGQAQARQQA
jgi:hypothetical protein